MSYRLQEFGALSAMPAARGAIALFLSPQGINSSYTDKISEHTVLDTRFDLFLCKKLDRIARDDWKQVTEKQFEKYKKQLDIATGAIAQSHNLAASNRTPNDDREVQQRKAEIESITPEQWEAMNKEYLVGKKDE